MLKFGWAHFNKKLVMDSDAPPSYCAPFTKLEVGRKPLQGTTQPRAGIIRSYVRSSGVLAGGSGTSASKLKKFFMAFHVSEMSLSVPVIYTAYIH
jgi:hypothetical protein